jgi:hypothetical protein
MNASKPKKSWLRWLPILAALFSCGVVGVIGVWISVGMNVPAGSDSSSPGRTIGAIALGASLLVFYVVKKAVDKKLEAPRPDDQSNAPKEN